MKINPGIFKAYDIRGIYPEDLNEDAAYFIGRAVVAHTNASTIVIGKDMRVSSEKLEESLVRGITDQGCDVIKIGLSTTPMLYYASGLLSVDAGIIITASHNPGNYNGFKICRKDAVPVGEGAGMEEIRALAVNAAFNDPEKKGAVSENYNFKDQYYRHIKRFFNAESSKKFKVVFDFANAMGIFDKPVIESLRPHIDPVYMYDDYDGRFPNHEANPLKTDTLEALQKRVIEEKADLGVSYDGDADRVGFVDEFGQIIPMDFISALIAKEILKKHAGGLVLIDLRSSNAVIETIEEAGGKVNLCRVGHSLIKKQMREDGAVFAGELSGHYYFEENYMAELSSLAVIMILNLMNETGQTPSSLCQPLRKYYHSGEINSKVLSRKDILARIKRHYNDGAMNLLDGIRIDYKDWWFNVRPSNTEPIIRLNLEAKTKKLMEDKRDELLNIIRS